MATDTRVRPDSDPAVPAELRRTDNWWVGQLAFFLLFSAFGMWATFRAFQNAYFYTAPYLSPFYSPIVPLHWHIANPTGIGARLLEFSPALLILPFPLTFRLSCYYYRKSIYRSYLADPAGCAVPEPKFLAVRRFRKYMGERAFPLIIQNFHRFTFYAAVVFIVILWKDTIDAFFFPGTDGRSHFGVGVGTLVFLANISLLTLYTFSCHSWRHLIGGSVDCFSCTNTCQTRYGIWRKVSALNERHGLWAMMSLVSVAVCDIYVYLVASHVIQDFRLF